jgi:hypothetical protein
MFIRSVFNFSALWGWFTRVVQVQGVQGWFTLGMDHFETAIYRAFEEYKGGSNEKRCEPPSTPVFTGWFTGSYLYKSV